MLLRSACRAKTEVCCHTSIYSCVPHMHLLLQLMERSTSASQKHICKHWMESYLVSWIMKSAQPINQVQFQFKWRHKNDQNWIWILHTVLISQQENCSSVFFYVFFSLMCCTYSQSFAKIVSVCRYYSIGKLIKKIMITDKMFIHEKKLTEASKKRSSEEVKVKLTSVNDSAELWVVI